MNLPGNLQSSNLTPPPTDKPVKSNTTVIYTSRLTFTCWEKRNDKKLERVCLVESVALPPVPGVAGLSPAEDVAQSSVSIRLVQLTYGGVSFLFRLQEE